MLLALLIGIITGFILAMPPGPISVATIRMSLSSSIKTCVFFASGTGMMDAIFFLAASFASVAAEAAIGNFSESNPIIMVIIQVIIIMAFITYGIYGLFSHKNPKIKDRSLSSRFKFIQYLKSKGPFLLGIAMALANVPNPSFLPSLVLVSTYLQKFGLFERDILNNFLFSIGFGIGNFLWIYLLIRIIHKYKTKFSPVTLIRIRQFAGVTFVGFATLLGYRMIILTKWPEIFRFFFAF